MDLISGFNDLHCIYLFPLGAGKAGSRGKHDALSLATSFPSKAVAHAPCMMWRERAAFLESLLTLVLEVPFPSLLCWISYLLCPMFFSCSFSLAGSQFLENDICHVWSCLYSLLSLGWHSGSVLNSIRKLYSFWVLRKCSFFLTYRVDMLFNTLYMTGFSIWMPWESSLCPVLKFHTDVPYVDPFSFIV